jgi:hypothetical protein
VAIARPGSSSTKTSARHMPATEMDAPVAPFDSAGHLNQTRLRGSRLHSRQASQSVFMSLLATSTFQNTMSTEQLSGSIPGPLEATGHG